LPHATRVSSAQAVAQFSWAVNRTAVAQVATAESRHWREHLSRRKRAQPVLHLLLAVTRH
jgi:hypothetical protein